eukprot:2386221-Rhodomonas_salina.3
MHHPAFNLQLATRLKGHRSCGTALRPIFSSIVLLVLVVAVACSKHVSTLVEGMIHTRQEYNWDMFAKYDVDSEHPGRMN